MATISLTVKTNFSDASKDIKSLGELTEQETNRMNKGLKNLSTESLERYERNLTRSTAAIKATKGETAALEHQQRALSSQIQKSIRAGIDPMDDSLKELQARYAEVNKQLEVNTKAQEMNANATRNAAVALGVLTAAAAASLKVAHDTAEMGDEYAKAAQRIGFTAEALQEYDFVANRSGVSSSTMQSSLQKLSKSIGDVRAGTGALTTLLREQNPQLLTQIASAENSNQAFEMMVDALNSTENQFDRAALAQAAFGRAGQELITITNLGAEGIAALREEARAYGIISNESAAKSELYMDEIANLQQSMIGLKSSISDQMIPAMTGFIEKIVSAVNGVTAFVSDTEKMERLLNIILPAIAGVAAGLASFLVISKLITLVKGLSTTMAALNAVLLANPAYAIAAGIAAITAAVVILGKKANERNAQMLAEDFTGLAEAVDGGQAAMERFAEETGRTVGEVELLQNALGGTEEEFKKYEDTIGRAQTALSYFQEEQDFDVVSNQVATFAKNLGLSTSEMLKAGIAAEGLNDDYKEILQSILDAEEAIYEQEGAMLRIAAQQSTQAGNAQTLAEQQARAVRLAEEQAAEEARITAELEAQEALRKQIEDRYQGAWDEYRKIIEGQKTELQLLDEQIERYEFLGNASDEYNMDRAKALEILYAKRADLMRGEDKTLEEHLASLNNAEAMARAENLATFDQFLSARMEQEEVGAENRISFLQEELARIKALETISNDEKLAAERVVQDEITRIIQEEEETRIASLERTREAVTAWGQSVFDSMSSLFGGIVELRQMAAAQEIEAETAKYDKILESATLSETEKERITAEKDASIAAIQDKANERIKEAAKLQKAADIASTVITTASGAMKAYNAMAGIPYVGPVLGGIAAAAVVAAGAIQIAKIKNTPLPTAETGGRFTVPEAGATATRADNVGLNVNAGETVEVIPRGEDTRRSLTINNMFDREVFWSVTQEGIDAGEITITNDNIREAV